MHGTHEHGRKHSLRICIDTATEIQVQMHSVFASAITVSKRAAMFTQVFSLDKIQEIMRIQKCQSPPSGDWYSGMKLFKTIVSKFIYLYRMERDQVKSWKYLQISLELPSPTLLSGSIRHVRNKNGECLSFEFIWRVETAHNMVPKREKDESKNWSKPFFKQCRMCKGRTQRFARKESGESKMVWVNTVQDALFLLHI